MKKTFIMLLIALSAFAVPSQVLLSSAAEGDEENSDQDYRCAQEVMSKGIELLNNYQLFLDEYFKADVPSSDQVEVAMSYFRFMEYTLDSYFNIGAGLEGQKTFNLANKEVAYCADVRDKYVEFARVLLQEQVLASANSKRTFKLVDGLKILNEDVSDFSDTFHATFPGMFNKMFNALPCFARQCITQ